MSEERAIMWTGDPICYKRPDGSSLVVGKYHYLFDTSGVIVSAQPVTRPILASLLQHLYKDQALAMAAYVKPVPDPKVYTEEDMQIRMDEVQKEAASQAEVAEKARQKTPQVPDLGG